MDDSALTRYYTTIYSQVFSPCGKYLAAASSYGNIAIFNVAALLNSETNVTDFDHTALQTPILTFKASERPIYALISTPDYLISTCSGSLIGISWNDLLKNKTAKNAWVLSLPDGRNYSKPETNALALSDKDDTLTLLAGCDDNNIYVFDLEAQKLKCKFSGHNDYIHCLTVSGGDSGNCWSGGEDGAVLAWDSRNASSPVHRIEPYKNEMCCRPNFGQWIGCVAVDGNDDWMVCGGGPSLCMWHLRSLSCTTTFPTPISCQTCVLFHEDTVISAGTEPNVSRWGFNGESIGKIPCTPFSIYSLVKQEDQRNKILCVAGTSVTIDVCSDFKYKDFSLQFA